MRCIVLALFAACCVAAPTVASVRELITQLRTDAESPQLRHGSPLPPDDTATVKALATAITLAVYPNYRTEETKVEMTTSAPSVYAPFAPLNTVGNQRLLADESVTWIPSPSRDVLYQAIWSFVGHGNVFAFHFGPAPAGLYRAFEFKSNNLYPFLLVHPPTYNMSESHDFLVLGEWTNTWLDAHLKDWREYLPEQYEVLVMPSQWLWISGRLEVTDASDEQVMTSLHDIEDATTYERIEDVLPSSNPIVGVLGRINKEEPVEYEVPSGEGIDAELSFWYQVGEFLKSNPLGSGAEWVWQYAPRVGLEKTGFNPAVLTSSQVAALKDGHNDAMAIIMNNLFQWGYHETTWLGITEYDDIYTEGVLDAIDWATYCFVGKSALPPDGAIYFFSWAYLENWAFGGMLDGSLDYQVVFSGGPPPVDDSGFWSLSVYDMNQRLVSAPYMIGSDSDIEMATPLILCLGPDYNSELCADEANYIPTPNNTQFMVELRAYLPLAPIPEHSYPLPYVIHPV